MNIFHWIRTNYNRVIHDNTVIACASCMEIENSGVDIGEVLHSGLRDCVVGNRNGPSVHKPKA